MSAADIQWPDLHRHMPAHDAPPADDHAAYRRHASDLNDNPALAAYYFKKRWDVFFETIVKQKLRIKDYWWRFEWQNRGSSHIHGFLWLEDAPKVEDLRLNEEDSVREFIDFWDPLVSTWNPGKNEPPAPQHPSAQDPTTLTDTQLELAQLLNRVQRHTKCIEGYCLRKAKQTGDKVCRFKFPQTLRDITEVVDAQGKSNPEFLTRRNDELLNSHNPLWILGWRANMDFRPILSKEAVVSYISKYASKAEKASSTYQQMLQTAMSHLQDTDRSGIAFQKLLSSLTAERDISGKFSNHHGHHTCQTDSSL
jgi:hypothetical protein